MRLARVFFVFCLAVAVCGAWVFSGWPQIWQNPKIPPQVREASAAETLWAESHITGSFSNPDNTLGATNGSWAGSLNTNGDATSRWAMQNPSAGIAGTQTIYVIARKGSNSGNPTITLTLYENGTSVSQIVSGQSVTSQTSQTITGTFDASEITNPNNVEIQVFMEAARGSPSARNSAQVDSIEWQAELDNSSPTVALNSPADSATDVSTTPTLEFTGTDPDDDDVRYNVQIDTVNTFNSTGGTNTYYFDASLGGPNDPDNVWTDDSNAFDGLTGTFDGALVQTNGSVSSNYLEGLGTTAPGSGGPITLVRARAYIGLSATGVEGNAAIYTENQGELLGTVTRTGSTGNDWSSYVELNEPTGGWTWDKAQKLEVRFYRTGSSNNLRIFRAEVEVTSGAPILDKVSGTDAGFSNTTDGGDTDPFDSGDKADYHVQAGDELDAETEHFWRVRAIDPSGTNTYGAWSSTRSFTTASGAVVSVTVDDGTVAYGTLFPGGQKDTTSGDLDDTQSVTNDGDGAQSFNIKGQDTSCPWALAGSAGGDQYVHEFSTDAGSSWTPLSTSYQTLSSGIASGSSMDLDLRLTAPTTTSCTTEQQVDVVIQAVAG